MSFLAVAPPARSNIASAPHPKRVAWASITRLRPCGLKVSRSMVVPRAAHPLQQVGEHLARFNARITTPLQITVPSREFSIAMLGFTFYNLSLNFTVAKVLTSAGFMLWPRMVERVCAERPMLRQLGLQMFNVVLVRGNPCGVMLAMAACYTAHQLTPHLPTATHQSVRTAAFWGALVGGARFNGLLRM